MYETAIYKYLNSQHIYQSFPQSSTITHARRAFAKGCESTTTIIIWLMMVVVVVVL